jgi:hypothetical protein
MNQVPKLQSIAKIWLISIAIITLINPQRAHAQFEELDFEQWKYDYHGFALLCRTQDLLIYSNLDEFRRLPADQKIVVCFGQLSLESNAVSEMRSRGTSVLIASDYQTAQLASMGLFIRGGPYRGANESSSYLGETEFPFAEVRDSEHPITEGINRVVTNLPSVISGNNRRELDSRNWRVLLGSSDLRRRTRGDAVLMAVQQRNSGGRVAVVADQSIFTNQMLTVGDNSKLAMETIAWLKQDQKNAVLILVDGQVVDPGDLMELEVPLPPITKEDVLENIKNVPTESLLQAVNNAAAEAENQNLHNDMIEAWIDSYTDHGYHRSLLAFATAFFVLIATRHLLVKRNRQTEHSNLTFSANPNDNLTSNRHTANLPLTEATSFQKNRQASLERQQAAIILFGSFCRELGMTDEFDSNMRTFKSELSRIANVGRIGHNVSRKEIKKTWLLLHKKPAKFWTKERLVKLHQEIEQWRQLH